MELYWHLIRKNYNLYNFIIDYVEKTTAAHPWSMGIEIIVLR